MSTAAIDTWAPCTIAPTPVNENLISRVGLLIGKGQYLDFTYSKLQERYRNVPLVIQESPQVNAFARQQCHRELALAASHPRIKIFLTGLKQASHHISALLQESDVKGAEDVLKLAEAKLHHLEMEQFEAHVALIAHEHILNQILFYRDQLSAVENDVYILEEMEAALEERAENINPLLGGEFVTPLSHQLCNEEFTNGLDPEDKPTPFEELMNRLKEAIAYGKEVVQACDVGAAERIVEYARALAMEVQVYLMELETAVSEFETANAMTEYSFFYFDEKVARNVDGKSVVNDRLFSSPSPFALVDHIGFAVDAHRMLGGVGTRAGVEKDGQTLKQACARLLDTPEEEDPWTAMDLDCGSDLTFEDFDCFDRMLNAVSHSFDDAQSLSYKDFDLLDEELLTEGHCFESAAGLSYTDFDLFDQTGEAAKIVVKLPGMILNPRATPFTTGGAETVVVSTPAKVYHPRPRNFSAERAVQKWMSA